MGALVPDIKSIKSHKDIDKLNGNKSLFSFPIISSVILAVILLVFLSSRGHYGARDANSVKHVDLSAGGTWSDDFLAAQQGYKDWLYSHGTLTEVNLFSDISDLLYKSASTVTGFQSNLEGVSFAGSIYLAAHLGLQRIVFILAASWRLWIFFILAGAILGIRSLKAYGGRDLLGQTGNRRLFFSGIRASLDELSTSGAPLQQVRGLACLTQVALPIAKVSAPAKILEKYQAQNPTNLALLAIILNYTKHPAYVAGDGEARLLESVFEQTNLAGNIPFVLETALALHQKYQLAQEEERGTVALPEPSALPEGVKMNSEHYGILLQRALHRVLTPLMRTSLTELSAAEIATMVLAHEAGKVMTYSFDAGKWLRKSNFPQLCARAVLHSMPSYPDDYSFDSRMCIRRALIYGSRMSVFAPVRFPVELSEPVRAARQWVELLMACPHELQTVADEVELFGIIGEVQRNWSQQFLDGVMALNPAVIEGVYATQTNLLFLPLPKLINLLRKTIDPQTLRRVEELSSLVHQKQRLHAMSLDFNESGGGHAGSSMERIYGPLSQSEMKALAEAHGVSLIDVRDWLAARIILNSFGWLARRVGDLTVPESSVVFAVLKAEVGSPEANALGLIGKPAMIPLRGTRLEEKWGKFWQSRFVSTISAQMAESRADFEMLMKGVEPSPVEEEAVGGANG